MASIPYLEMDELTALFGYKNLRAARYAIRKGKFPVATYELAGRLVANVDVVNAYFRSKTEEAIATRELLTLKRSA